MIAASFLDRAGFAQKPEIPPTVSASKVTSVGATSRSMTSSNGARAAAPASLPLNDATAARRPAAAIESPWLTGWTVSQGACTAVSPDICRYLRRGWIVPASRGSRLSPEPALLASPDAEAVPVDFGIERSKTDDVRVVSNAVEPLEHARLIFVELTKCVDRKRRVLDVPARHLTDCRGRRRERQLVRRDVDSLTEETLSALDYKRGELRDIRKRDLLQTTRRRQCQRDRPCCDAGRHPLGEKVLHEEDRRDDRERHSGPSYLFLDLELAVEMRNPCRSIGASHRRVDEMLDTHLRRRANDVDALACFFFVTALERRRHGEDGIDATRGALETFLIVEVACNNRHASFRERGSGRRL